MLHWVIIALSRISYAGITPFSDGRELRKSSLSERLARDQDWMLDIAERQLALEKQMGLVRKGQMIASEGSEEAVKI